METGVTQDLISCIQKEFELKPVDIRTYSPLTLAYIGDGVYELIIRTVLVEQGNLQPAKLHKKSSGLVKAAAQAAMIRGLEAQLTEEELSAYKRGRNAKAYHTAKNASVADYRTATGFEALMGWLYLTGRYERMVSLIRAGLEYI
jgi:ribonuclease-3 family protein